MGWALGGFAKALAWFFSAVGQTALNVWDRLTHHTSREARRAVEDDST